MRPHTKWQIMFGSLAGMIAFLESCGSSSYLYFPPTTASQRLNTAIFVAISLVPVIKTRSVPEPLAAFNPVTSDEVKRSLGKAPAKHCILDPAPTWLLKRVDDVISPVIARM